MFKHLLIVRNRIVVSKPLLSICLITYNQAKYIRESIDSILMQRVNFEWELIIADDYSTDGTRQIIKDYQKQLPNSIKLILQKKNYGPEKNWLDLMEYPKTKYVIYTEGDDYFSDPLKLQKQVDFLETHADFSMCFHPVRVEYEDGSQPDRIFPSKDLIPKGNILGLGDLLARNIIQTNSAMYRWRFKHKSIKDEFPRYITPGDWFLHLLHAQLGKVGYLNRVMSVYRRHPGALWWESTRDVSKIWAKHGLNHLAMYYEVLKISHNHPEYTKIVNKNINNALSEILTIPVTEREQVLAGAMTKFPNMIINFIEELKQSNADYEKTIRSLSVQLDAKNRAFDDLHTRLNLILNSGSWRTAQRLSKAHQSLRRKKN